MDAHTFSLAMAYKGRVLYDVFVYYQPNHKGQDGYFIDYDSRPSEAPPLEPFLKRFVLRSKVKIEHVSEQWDVWQAWGSEKTKEWDGEREWNWARSGVVEPVWQEEQPWGSVQQGTRIRDRRAVGMGERLIVRKGERRELVCRPRVFL